MFLAQCSPYSLTYMTDHTHTPTVDIHNFLKSKKNSTQFAYFTQDKYILSKI